MPPALGYRPEPVAISPNTVTHFVVRRASFLWQTERLGRIYNAVAPAVSDAPTADHFELLTFFTDGLEPNATVFPGFVLSFDWMEEDAPGGKDAKGKKELWKALTGKALPGRMRLDYASIRGQEVFLRGAQASGDPDKPYTYLYAGCYKDPHLVKWLWEDIGKRRIDWSEPFGTIRTPKGLDFNLPAVDLPWGQVTEYHLKNFCCFTMVSCILTFAGMSKNELLERIQRGTFVSWDELKQQLSKEAWAEAR